MSSCALSSNSRRVLEASELGDQIRGGLPYLAIRFVDRLGGNSLDGEILGVEDLWYICTEFVGGLGRVELDILKCNFVCKRNLPCTKELCVPFKKTRTKQKSRMPRTDRHDALDAHLPPEITDEVLKHEAAKKIQSFFRRSVYYVEVETDQDGRETYPERQVWKPTWKPRHAEHGSGQFETFRQRRTLKFRCKPLKMMLQEMMKQILECKKLYHTPMRKKRENRYFKISLIRRFKKHGRAGEVTMITVTHDTVFR